MLIRARGILTTLASIVLVVVVVATSAWADDATDDTADLYEPIESDPVNGEEPTGIEVIVVTSQRRESYLQQTPIAITSFTQAELDQRGVSDLQGLSINVPNFHYGEVLGQARITIRGISTAGGDQATAFHIDGIYQDSSLIPSSLTFFDLAAVETLRGPQGTLGGRNATGGALFVTTQPPQFDFELFGDIQFGNYHEVVTRGVVNIPIVEDKVAVRFSVIQDRHYGYTENLAVNVRSHDVDDKRLVGMRSQIRLKPADSIDWVIRSIYSRSNPRGGGLRIEGDLPDTAEIPVLGDHDIFRNGSPNPLNVRQIYLDTPEQTNTTLLGASTTFNWEVPELRILGDTGITVVGSWQERVQATLADIDRSDATGQEWDAAAMAFRGPREPLAETGVDLRQQEWLVEANWASRNGSDPLAWVVGAFYLGTSGSFATETTASFPLMFGNTGNLGRTEASSLLTSNDRAFAGFFNASYEFFDQLTLEAGARYTYDDKAALRHSDQADFVFQNGGRACVVAGYDSDKSNEWDAFTGQVKLQWQYTDDNMVYGSFSRGYKAGSIEGSIADDDADTAPFECPPRIELQDTVPEKIYAYEIGLKNGFFDNKLQANLTGFFYDYTDIQVATLVGATVITENADAAEVAGVELEFTWLPWSELLLTLNAAYLYAEFTDYTNGCLVEDPLTCREEDPDVPGSGYLDFTGNKLPRAPRFSGTFTGQYDFDLGELGRITPFVQIFASDKIFFRAANLAKDVQDPFWLLDARLTWESADQHYMLEAFVRNAFDKNIINTKLVSSPLLGSPVLTAFAPPRTVGGRVTLRW